MEAVKRGERIVAIDLFRIFSVVFIFLFHACIHMGCEFGFMSEVVRQGAVFMTAFFLISGVALFYSNQNKDLHSVQGIAEFYKKRIVALYPAYVVICLIFLFFDYSLSVLNKTVLFPMDLMLLQSSMDGAFGTWHHGGTWFISCLLFCYLPAPFFIESIKQIGGKTKLILGIIIYIACAYMPVAVHIMGYSSLYSNSIFRCLQFLLGMVLAGFIFEKEAPQNSSCFNSSWLIILLLIFFGGGVSALGKIGGSYRDYDFFVIPIFVLLIGALLRIPFSSGIGRKIASNKFLKYLNTIAYEFFLGQFFCFKLTAKIVQSNDILNTDLIKTLLSGIICLIIAAVLHELITKPCKRVFNKQ